MMRILLMVFIITIGFCSKLNSQCKVEHPPHITRFDSLPWFLAPGNQKIHDTCWIRNSGPNSYINWYLSDRSEPNTPDSTGPKLTFGAFLSVLPLRAGTGNETAVITTPRFISTNLKNPVLQFSYHMYGNNIDKLIIQRKDSSSKAWIKLDSLVGNYQSSSEDFFKRHHLELGQMPDTTRFQFIAKSKGGPNYQIALDNIYFGRRKSCPLVNKPVISSKNDTSATLQFNNSYNVNVESRVTDIGRSPMDSIGNSFYTNGNSITLSSINAGNQYYIYLRTFCQKDTSAWLPPMIFKATCSKVYEFPFRENFNDWMGDSIRYFQASDGQFNGKTNACWENPNFGRKDSYHWKSFSSLPNRNVIPVQDKSGNGVFVGIKEDHIASGVKKSILASPPISLHNSTNPLLSFWYHTSSLITQGYLIVESSTSKGNWQILDSIALSSSTINSPWLQYQNPLNARPNDTLKVRFRITNRDSYVYLDEIEIKEKPGCAMAGPDSTVQVCDTLISLPLDLLLDSNAYGGNWQDLSNSGALSPASVLDLTALPKDSAFFFRYLIPADSTCSADSATFTIIRNKAGCKIGLREYRQEPGLEIYPNPARDELHLHPAKAHAQWGRIALYSLQGQRLPVKLRKESEGGMLLSLQQVPAGVYLLEVKLNGRWIQRKVVKE